MTLPVESRFNYTTIDISPNGSMLVAINAGKTSFCTHICKNDLFNNIYEGVFIEKYIIYLQMVKLILLV